MNTAIVCLGSNVQESSTAKIKEANHCLQDNGCYVMTATPLYGSASNYLNQVIEIETELNYEDLHKLTKATENQLGRTSEMKQLGVVPIDIDIVLFNGTIIRELDYNSEYFQIGYSQITKIVKP